MTEQRPRDWIHHTHSPERCEVCYERGLAAARDERLVDAYETGKRAMLAELRAQGMLWTEPSADSPFEGEYGLAMEPGKSYAVVALPVCRSSLRSTSTR